MPTDLPAMARKRFMLGRALSRIRRGYSKNIASTNVRVSDKKAVAAILALFTRTRDPVFGSLKKKTLAPGGAPVGKEDIFTANVTDFHVTPNYLYGQNRTRFKRKLTRLVRALNSSRHENGKFFYRFHNAVYVLRAPSSAHELFSVARIKFSPYYNPRTIQFFLSHRFWH
jgi:hypothetical protein